MVEVSQGPKLWARWESPYPFCWGIGGLAILLLFFPLFLVTTLVIIYTLIICRYDACFFDDLC